MGDVCVACLTWVMCVLPLLHGDVCVACLTWVMCLLPVLHG